MTASAPTTAPKQPQADVTLTVPVSALLGMLTDLERTAHDDNDLPMLRGLTLHTSNTQPGDNRLYATSTNRYILAQAFEPAHGALPPTFLTRQDIRMASAVLRAADPGQHPEWDRSQRGYRAPLSAELRLNHAGHLTVHVDRVATLTLNTRPPHTLDTQRIITQVRDAQPAHTSLLGATLLETLTYIAQRRAEPMRIGLREARQPATIEIGDRYLAILMPVAEPTTVPEPFRFSHVPAGPDLKERHG